MSDLTDELKIAAENGGIHSSILCAARLRITNLEALIDAYINLDETTKPYGKEVFEEKLELQAELTRKDAQIKKAIAILRDGTDYEKIHVPAILENALSSQ